MRLAYDEAVTAIIYMVDTYGDKKFANLLAAYKNGIATNDAFPEAFGVTFGEFESAWATWLGATADTFQTPTPWALPTFPASPTPRVVVQGSTSTPSVDEIETPTPPSSEATATSAPVATILPTNTPPIQEVAVEEVNPPSVTLAPEQSSNSARTAMVMAMVVCCCLLFLGMLGVGAWLYSRRNTEG